MIAANPQAARAQAIIWNVGLCLIGAFLVATGILGLVRSAGVAAAFQAGAPLVQWSEATDLTVMLAPPLAALLGFATWRLGLWAWSSRFVLLRFVVLTVLIGWGLGELTTAALEAVAARHGYQACHSADVISPHGSRGGGPALISSGYARGACPARD